MKNKHLILLLLTFPVTTIIALELIILGPVRQDSFFVDSTINARMGEIHCLIAGDSHPAAAFRRELEGRCDNMATGGTSIWMIDDLVRSVMESNKLERIILSIGPHNFASYRIENRSKAFENIAEWFTPGFNPLSHNQAIVGFMIKWKDKQLLKIQGKKIVDKHIYSKLAPSRIAMHMPVEKFSQSKIADTYIGLLRHLKEKGVEICVIRTPVTENYDFHLSKHYSKQAWENMVARVKSMGIKYVSETDVFPSYTQKWFRNPEHLSVYGAQRYAPETYRKCFN